MDTLFLTGFMGAGKTTVGKQLGKRLGYTVFDTDEIIAKIFQTPIKTIFSEKGEEAFRTYESEVLRKVTWENVIVTTGGGIIKKQQNRNWMKDKGTVVFLHCEPDELFKRLEGDRERPLLHKKESNEILSLLDERLPLYLEADYTINTSGRSVNEIAEDIIKHLVNNQKIWA